MNIWSKIKGNDVKFILNFCLLCLILPKKTPYLSENSLPFSSRGREYSLHSPRLCPRLIIFTCSRLMGKLDNKIFTFALCFQFLLVVCHQFCTSYQQLFQILNRIQRLLYNFQAIKNIWLRIKYIYTCCSCHKYLLCK